MTNDTWDSAPHWARKLPEPTYNATVEQLAERLVDDRHRKGDLSQAYIAKKADKHGLDVCEVIAAIESLIAAGG